MMVGRRSMQHNTDIAAWERRWSAMHPCCVGKVRLAGSFDMSFARHANEVTYVVRFYGLLWK